MMKYSKTIAILHYFQHSIECYFTRWWTPFYAFCCQDAYYCGCQWGLISSNSCWQGKTTALILFKNKFLKLTSTLAVTCWLVNLSIKTTWKTFWNFLNLLFIKGLPTCQHLQHVMGLSLLHQEAPSQTDKNYWALVRRHI